MKRMIIGREYEWERKTDLVEPTIHKTEINQNPDMNLSLLRWNKFLVLCLLCWEWECGSSVSFWVADVGVTQKWICLSAWVGGGWVECERLSL